MLPDYSVTYVPGCSSPSAAAYVPSLAEAAIRELVANPDAEFDRVSSISWRRIRELYERLR